MKYCTKCGAQIHDDAVVCVSCGCPTTPTATTENVAPKTSGLKTAAMILMIVGTIINGLTGFLIPLIWCLPMTLSYCNKVKRGEPVSLGFKICSLLFVSMVGGILMICDSDK